jgi:hypothetical protein
MAGRVALAMRLCSYLVASTKMATALGYFRDCFACCHTLSGSARESSVSGGMQAMAAYSPRLRSGSDNWQQ